MSTGNKLLDLIDANGRICCIISRTCCIPPGAVSQERALAEIIWAGSEVADQDARIEDLPEWALKAARAVRARVDMVPHGAGALALRMAKLYLPHFEREKSHGE